MFRTRSTGACTFPPVLLTLLVMVPIAVLLVMNLLAMWAARADGVRRHLRARPRTCAGMSSEFAVTNKRVVIKLGVMTTRSLELLLPKVEGIAVNQGVGGKLWGYGDIVVTGSGGTKEAFSGIQDPLALRRAIQEAADAREQPANG